MIIKKLLSKIIYVLANVLANLIVSQLIITIIFIGVCTLLYIYGVDVEGLIMKACKFFKYSFLSIDLIVLIAFCIFLIIDKFINIFEEWRD